METLSAVGNLIVFSLIIIAVALALAFRNLIKRKTLWSRFGMFIFIFAYSALVFLLVWVFPSNILDEINRTPKWAHVLLLGIIIFYFGYGYTSTEDD